MLNHEKILLQLLPHCLCSDKAPRHVQEAKVHHQLSIPCFVFFLQQPYYVAASMAADYTQQ